jgi:hypothetical protein
MNLETTIIIALITLSGSLISFLIQLRTLKSQAKKLEAESNKVDLEASGIIVDSALKMHKQSFEVLQYLNETLEKSVRDKEIKLAEKERIIEQLKDELADLKGRK